MGRQKTQEGRLTGAARESERRPGFRAAGVAASRIAQPILARHGGGVLARLKAEWSAVAGGEIAAVTWPEALARTGELKLRVASARALEIQHRAPLLIERINLFLGRAVVSRLVLVQAPLPLPPEPRRTLPVRLDPAEARALDDRLDAVADPELRAALAGLGRAVIGTGDNDV
jgi:hypothetical protein